MSPGTDYDTIISREFSFLAQLLNNKDLKSAPFLIVKLNLSSGPPVSFCSIEDWYC